jgi:hypothetical protein
MNPGIVEETSKAAQSTIDALKSTPIVLALVIFNILFMFAMMYGAIRISERWDREIERWAELVRACQNITIHEKSQSEQR